MRKLPIDITLLNGEIITLTIYAHKDDILFEQLDAAEYGESVYQIVEGKTYDYELSSEKFQLFEPSTITNNPSHKFSAGNIKPGIYVGTLKVDVVKRNEERTRVGELRLEVRSVKASYRDDYRQMLSDITDQCSELLMQHTSPSVQRFTVNPDSNPRSDYQRFAFVSSIVQSDLFEEALHHIQQSPVKRWAFSEEERSINNVRRFGNKEIKQLVRSNQRIELQNHHPLTGKFSSVPRTIVVTSKEETEDIPENRFIKHVLQTFLAFCSSIMSNDKADERLKREADVTCSRLNYYLGFPLFRNLSEMKMLPLNSPILQRKEGYREILQKWLMFDMASCLTWDGGEDVYEAGKKNVAILYEYWLFFKLLELFSKKFNIEPIDKEKLIASSENGLSLSLKQGNVRMLKGTFETASRSLNVCFYYNRPFGYSETYGKPGSWTQSMRPDYTLTIWPNGINPMEAEEEELITHVHFDAKYRVDNIQLTDKNLSIDEESVQKRLSDQKLAEEKGFYKRADLLKMHAYKDAIKRTSGAYILYPGTENEIITGYHEIIPGLGAFAISPKNYDDSLKEFNEFIDKVVENFIDRTSQRERMAYHKYKVLQEPSPEIRVNIPETIDENRGLMPTEINVLVGYCNPNNRDWLINRYQYNIRTKKQTLKDNFVTSKYLLLWNEDFACLYKMSKAGVGVVSERKFVEEGYESSALQKFVKQGHKREEAISMIKAESSYYIFRFGEAEVQFRQINWNTEGFSKKPHVTKLSELLMNVSY